MADIKSLVPTEGIEKKIYFIRGQKVILDIDLAELFGVETKRLNEQVKRNLSSRVLRKSFYSGCSKTSRRRPGENRDARRAQS